MGTGSDPVTQDGLSASLSQLELRIVSAISVAVKPIADRQAAFDRGEFNLAQTRALEAVTEGVLDNRGDSRWTTKARLITVVSVVIAFLGTSASVALAASTLLGG